MAYQERFSRNLGWVTELEQEELRGKCVAIAGLGGVGGRHLETLTRLGIGRFTLSDLDVFELANVNRQAGASQSTMGQPKIEVMTDRALDINPDLVINSEFHQGINAANVEAFLEGADVYVDGLDFFAVRERCAVFAACAKLGIPAVTAAPLGMSVALLNFLPGGVTFEEYFRLEGHDEVEQLRRFYCGLAPASLQAPYLRDPSTIDLKNHKGPSKPMGVDLCAGVAGTQVLKILLDRNDPPIIAAPEGLQFDAYRYAFVRTRWTPWALQDPAEPLRVGAEAVTVES
ncbi:MAG: ThiF family adenylyltransferase [Phycisphaeraceae bacterium]